MARVTYVKKAQQRYQTIPCSSAQDAVGECPE